MQSTQLDKDDDLSIYLSQFIYMSVINKNLFIYIYTDTVSSYRPLCKTRQILVELTK